MMFGPATLVWKGFAAMAGVYSAIMLFGALIKGLISVLTGMPAKSK